MIDGRPPQERWRRDEIGDGNGGAGKGALTRSGGLLLLIGPGLVPPRRLPQGLIAGADRHDGQQGEDQRRGTAHVPLGEDDAEVLGVPSEEHLYGWPEAGPINYQLAVLP